MFFQQLNWNRNSTRNLDQNQQTGCYYTQGENDICICIRKERPTYGNLLSSSIGTSALRNRTESATMQMKFR
jgi:hypothetical protein